MDLTQIKMNLERNGFRKTLLLILYMAINKFIYLRIFSSLVMTKDSANLGLLKYADNYWMGILENERLLNFVKPEYEIEEQFIKIARKKGDTCIGNIKGDVLASYSWYSNQSTEVEADLIMNFDPQYIYMYKGYTRNDYRGKRLIGANGVCGCLFYEERGYKGIVTIVEAVNFVSLKHCHRMGLKKIGNIYILKIGKKSLFYHNKKCKNYGIIISKNS